MGNQSKLNGARLLMAGIPDLNQAMSAATAYFTGAQPPYRSGESITVVGSVAADGTSILMVSATRGVATMDLARASSIASRGKVTNKRVTPRTGAKKKKVAVRLKPKQRARIATSTRTKPKARKTQPRSSK
jgi:hypothetical protein